MDPNEYDQIVKYLREAETQVTSFLPDRFCLIMIIFA